MDGTPRTAIAAGRQPESDALAIFLSDETARQKSLGFQITDCAARIQALYNERAQHMPAPTFGSEEGQLRQRLRNDLIPAFMGEAFPHRCVLGTGDRVLLETLLQPRFLREADTRRYEGHLAALKPLFDI